ncbi:hypothetical protein PR003_g32205 [Phytophthora rubi]|uniref:Uncharacterized protein n=1 Tax=Phytophthora rubi TaxID=129364 RepID=A0A6A3GMZ5_9STRA|nr:hypothetical protein PR002_g30767 [Phytophthora rubi]KAE9266205.1 hypothetical protein PR003_g32205 [Phytophthora rubi]
MKCSFTGCANPELTKTDPCSVCKRAVHHLCSNDLFDPGNLAVRTSCVDKWKAGILPPATSAVDDQPVTFEIVGWSPGPPAQLSSASVGLSFSQSSEETLPLTTDPVLTRTESHLTFITIVSWVREITCGMWRTS